MFLKKYLPFILVVLLLFITIPAYKNQIFSTRFVDEEYNFAIGRYLTKREILYDDIITNHLPVTHILSSLIQRKEKPETTYALINDHRTAIINWSAIWSFILVLYFGTAGLIFIVIYELTRSHLYGNLFLAETVVAYPIVFLIGLSLFKKFPLGTFEAFLVGALLAFSALTLGPLWPGIFFLCLLILIKQLNALQSSKLRVKSTVFGLAGALSVFVLVLPYVNIQGFLEYYIFGNLTGMIPNTSQYWLNSVPQSIASPLISFIGNYPSDQLILIRALSAILIINLTFLILSRRFQLAVSIFILLGLLNIRFIRPGEGHSSGFHLLPWFSGLVTIASFLFVEQFKNKSPYIVKGLNIAFLIIAIFFSLKYAKLNLFIEKNTERDYEIFFSTHTKIGESIKSIRNPGDTLFVFPDAWLVYWQSDTDHLPKLFGYYAWMAGIPRLRERMQKSFVNNPPKFFYCEGCKKNTELGQYLKIYSGDRGYEKVQNLFVLNTK